MKKSLVFGALFLALVPAAAYAQLENVEDLAIALGNIINILLPVVAALALLYFFWGLAKFILSGGDEEAKEKGKHIMIWGVVALFVLSSVWGLVAFLKDTFGISDTSSTPVPTFEP